MLNRINIISEYRLTPVKDLKTRQFVEYNNDVWFVTDIKSNDIDPRTVYTHTRTVHIVKLVGMGTIGLDLRCDGPDVQCVVLEKATFRHISS